MASHEPRILALESISSTVIVRLDFAEKSIDEHKKYHDESKETIANLRRECETKLALLNREVDDLRKSKETIGSRTFTVVFGIFTAVLGAALALSGNALIHVWFPGK
jgi:hypothetical protein